jgi:Skp family chaperone for outer membrane proteins
MKQIHLILALFAITAFAVGCKPKDESAATDASRELDQAKKETKEAVQATKEYAYAQKAEFVAKMREELAELNKKMDELSTKIDNSTGTAKEEAKAKLKVLREKSAGLKEKLDDVGKASESTWEEVKTGFKKAYQEVKESVNDSRQWLGDKISP